MIPVQLRPLVFYFLRLTLICGSILFTVNLLTSTATLNHVRTSRLASFSTLLPTAHSFIPYAKNRTLQNAHIIIGKDASQKKVGYIIHSTGYGYGGPINILVGLSGSKVTGIEILSHSETAGMGAMIANHSPMAGRAFTFQGQFSQKSVFDQFSTHEDIIALSGATISSQGVGDAIQAAIKIYRRLENIQYEN